MIVFVIIGLLIIGSLIHHRIKLKQESALREPIGKRVEVDGKYMSVYCEGEGEETLVFLAGSGTCSPILDFKSLYTELSDTYRIVVIEKFGYGFSDIVDSPRDIDTILEESRTALRAMKIDGPYVLLPHSMSGLQAIRWAQKYPDEVQAIIGLDMATAELYASYDQTIPMPMVHLLNFAAKTGLIRLVPNIEKSAAVEHGTLTDQEKEQYKAIFYNRSMTDTMRNEILAFSKSAKMVYDAGVPQLPMLLFVSDGSDVGFANWQNYQENLAKEVPGTQIIPLDAPHYIHDYAYERIAKEVRGFLE